MLIGFGKHASLNVQQIMLRQPDYVVWMQNQPVPGKSMLKVLTEVNRLAILFDAKTPIHSCSGSGCSKIATYATGYSGNPSTLYWWCNSCNPYSSGAMSGKLHKISTFSEALKFAQYCGGTKSDFRTVVLKFSEGKGAPNRLTATAAAMFLP